MLAATLGRTVRSEIMVVELVVICKHTAVLSAVQARSHQFLSISPFDIRLPAVILLVSS